MSVWSHYGWMIIAVLSLQWTNCSNHFSSTAYSHCKPFHGSQRNQRLFLTTVHLFLTSVYRISWLFKPTQTHKPAAWDKTKQTKASLSSPPPPPPSLSHTHTHTHTRTHMHTHTHYCRSCFCECLELKNLQTFTVTNRKKIQKMITAKTR